MLWSKNIMTTESWEANTMVMRGQGQAERVSIGGYNYNMLMIMFQM